VVSGHRSTRNKPPKSMRPVMVKAQIVNAFAITGRFAFTYPYTQGNALGYVLNFG
jgi:hypothetical protein